MPPADPSPSCPVLSRSAVRASALLTFAVKAFAVPAMGVLVLGVVAAGVLASAGVRPVFASPGSPAATSWRTAAVRAADRAADYQLPLVGPLSVVNGFDDVADRYAAGHRGVDLALPVGSQVLAAGAGVVRFAGSVAGRGVVVVRHADGVTTEYEPLTVKVATGQHVARGEVIGTLASSHAGCARSCLHWGAQRAGRYFDPLSLLRPLGIVRLVPCQARGWACS